MTTERVVLTMVAAGLAAVMFTGLSLAAGTSWPVALMAGLGAGGSVFACTVHLLSGSDQDRR
ncbi:hypothetical protein [Microtetraspora malaysiensis]|uniref:hypothetical protein n=1 Tax=Microtetraspora malaysiensis TaxID=161358 RepID=UPI003D8B8ABA